MFQDTLNHMEKGLEKTRKSNIELLRILSMLMVLNVHTFLAPEHLNISNLNGIQFLRISIDFFREATSISCVNLFVIISGYFSIKWKIKGISSLIFQVYFWIFIIYGICLSFGYISFGWKDFIRYCMGIMSCYWFIPTYIGLYVLSPLLNSFVEASSSRQLLIYIGIFYFFFFVDSLPFCPNYSSNGYSIFSFCGLYLIGRFLRTSSFTRKKIFNSKAGLIGSIIAITLLIAVNSIFFSIISHKGGTDLITSIMSPLAYNNPLVLIQTILIFILFTKLNIQSKTINWCAVSALSIYLLHMHPAIKDDFYSFIHYSYSQELAIQYISFIMLFISIILIAIPIDKIRIWIFDKIYSFLESKKSNLP